jgi:hypothetical protein
LRRSCIVPDEHFIPGLEAEALALVRRYQEALTLEADTAASRGRRWRCSRAVSPRQRSAFQARLGAAAHVELPPLLVLARAAGAVLWESR